MLVKAKWSVKDSSGWHNPGDVFLTEDNLGDSVEIIETAKKTEEKKPEPEKETAKAVEKKPDKPAEAPRTRRKSSK